MDRNHQVNRLKGFGATVALLFSLGAACGQQAAPEGKAAIFYAMDKTSIGAGRTVNARVVRRMVDHLICGLTGKPTVAQAWLSLVSPTDIVGIKVAAGGGAVSGTNPEVVDAIAEGLREAGVPPQNIIVWDRGLEDLLAAGFRKDAANYVLKSIDSAGGYDAKALVSAPVLGRLIWGDSKFGQTEGQRLADLLSTGDQLSNKSFYAKILSSQVTKVINVPSLADNFLTGINGALVNMTLSNLDNWRRFTRAPDHGDPFIAEIYSDEMIRGKVVLTVLDALFLQYAGGPFPNPNFAIENHALFMSKDPVAIDATALRLIEETRIASKMPSIKDLTRYIESASLIGLGQYSDSRIEMVRIGVEGIR